MNLEIDATKNWNSFIGRMIEGRYLIQKKIGEGGIGAIYLAEDTKVLKRQVVIKVLRENWTNDAAIRRKFEHEKESLSRLDHPGIVSILDAGVLPEDKPYFVMPFIAGRTLRQVLNEQKPLPLNVCADVIESVCEALQAAHAAGVLHRDIKPENMILSEQANEKIRVRLIDFGVARVLNSQISPITEAGRPVGTILYIAPEQLLGSRQQTPATDIYSCGIVVYEMLTGKLPFQPRSIVEMWQMQSAGLQQKPSELRGELSAETDDIIGKVLACEPAERFQQASDFGRSTAFALRRTNNDKKTNFNNLKTEAATDLKTADIFPSPKDDKAETFADIKETDGNTENLWLENQNSTTGEQFITERADEIKFEFPEFVEPSEENVKKKSIRSFILTGIIGVILLTAIVPFLFYVFKQQPETKSDAALPENISNASETATMQQKLEFFLEVRKKRGKNQDGEIFRGDGQEIFSTGDRFKINVSSALAGQIYLFNEGKDKAGKLNFYLLFPSRTQQNGLPQVKAGQRVITGANEFTGAPGTETLWIIWSKELVPEFEQARQNALQNGGVVRNTETAQRLSDILQNRFAAKSEIVGDFANRRTILNGSDDLIIHRIELEHR